MANYEQRTTECGGANLAYVVNIDKRCKVLSMVMKFGTRKQHRNCVQFPKLARIGSQVYSSSYRGQVQISPQSGLAMECICVPTEVGEQIHTKSPCLGKLQVTAPKKRYEAGLGY